MDAFSGCRTLEERSWHIVEPVVAKCSRGVYTPLFTDMDAQQSGYDMTATLGELGDQKLELKAELKDKYGNFFLETWSNKSWMRAKAGWMFTIQADWLLYHFIENERLYWVPCRELIAWFFGTDDLNSKPGWMLYPERLQKRHEQKNKTAGVCVPIEKLWEHVGFIEMNLSDWDKVFSTVRDHRKDRAA